MSRIYEKTKKLIGVEEGIAEDDAIIESDEGEPNLLEDKDKRKDYEGLDEPPTVMVLNERSSLNRPATYSLLMAQHSETLRFVATHHSLFHTQEILGTCVNVPMNNSKRV